MIQKLSIIPEKPKHIRLFHVSEDPDIKVFEPCLWLQMQSSLPHGGMTVR